MAGGADHQLLDAVRRRLRRPDGWLVVALHLSRLAPPAPRPHHRRIAHALMRDVARRHDGEVHVLGGGDLALLCRDAPSAAAPAAPALRVAAPRALPEVLGRLLRVDAPDPEALVSLWPLEGGVEPLLRYAREAAASAPRSPDAAREPMSQLGAAAGLAAVLDEPDITDLLRRQTAAVIGPDGARPLFREVRFSLAAMAAGGAAAMEADPFLLRHLAERMDRRMLALLRDELGGGRALDAAAPGAPPLHVNLTLAGLRSDEFSSLARAAPRHRLRLGVELSVLEACAEPERFAAGREALGRLGMPLVLDGVSDVSASLARVAALRPDLVKLAWSPRLAAPDRLAAGARDRLIRDLGPERVILHHAASEAAVQWGLRRGISRFQGRHVDVMLAMSRMSRCAMSAACRVSECAERAGSARLSGRLACRDHAALDDADARVAA